MASGSSFQLSAGPASLFAHSIATAIATLVLVWLLHFREGLAFRSDNKFKIFNLHPLLTVIGFLLFAGEAIMAYKTVPGKRNTQKRVHLVFHFIALLAGILGIYAAFKFHNDLQIENMYSFHSWVGMSTICLFGFQWVLGFFSFWWPGAETRARAKLAPWHAFGGIVIFSMAIVSAETGLVEHFTFLNLGRSQEALIVNFTGVLILLFAISVGLSALLPPDHRLRRPPSAICHRLRRRATSVVLPLPSVAICVVGPQASSFQPSSKLCGWIVVLSAESAYAACPIAIIICRLCHPVVVLYRLSSMPNRRLTAQQHPIEPNQSAKTSSRSETTAACHHRKQSPNCSRRSTGGDQLVSLGTKRERVMVFLTLYKGIFVQKQNFTC
ncbi:Ascorbate ferrireductase (transmembrane) [Bertholletia excelsa]